MEHKAENLFELDTFSLFDKSDCLEKLRDEKLLIDLLHMLIEKSLPADTHVLRTAYQQKNWTQIKEIAHKIKGGAVYCGAIRLKFAAQHLERFCTPSDQVLTEQLYQQLISVIADTSMQIKKFLDQVNIDPKEIYR